MNTEPLVSTGIEKSQEDLERRIKPAADVARCFECDGSQLTLTKYILLATDEKILLCSGCANNLSSKVERPIKLTKKEKRKLKNKGLIL